MVVSAAGETLRRLRKRHGVAKYRLEQQTGISHANIFMFEAGTRRMNVGHIAAFIEAMELSVDEIEYLIRAVKDARTADLDDLLQREYVRLYPNGIVKAVTHG